MIGKSLAVAGVALAMLAAPIAASASSDSHGTSAITFAVYGDAPYGTTPTDTSEFQATPAFIQSVNADPDVSGVIHVGDIHSGKQYCTEAYDRSVAALWTQFADPLVYTPGDNEWSDCHKAGEGGGTYDATTGQINYVTDPSTGLPIDYAGGNPVSNLALVRTIFFPNAGQTLGGGSLHVLSQAQVDNSAHPTDGQYIENVMWQQKGFVFVTLNVPGGSNNDADPWYGAPSASLQQTTEAAERTAADTRWLDRAFTAAQEAGAQGVVVVAQADMWDLDGKAPAHLSNYEPIVSSLASHTLSLGKPVLLFTGDSHTYRSDNPLQQAAPCVGDNDVCAYDSWSSHPFYSVPNFHRIVVHGSTFPLEWLKLTITPGGHLPSTATSFGPFSWQRMPQS